MKIGIIGAGQSGTALLRCWPHRRVPSHDSRSNVDFRSKRAVHRALVGNLQQPGALFRR